MIPKKIHYCWFGEKRIPTSIKKNIESWEKYCPDFEIKCWNEKNYDLTKNSYVRAAYNSKNYAFLTDYVRLDVVSKEGGIYLDTDVELLKPINKLIENGNFMAFESKGRVATGLGFGFEAHNSIIQENRKYYETHNFIDSNGNFDPEICVKITTKILLKYGLKLEDVTQRIHDITIYSSDYFAPLKAGRSNINFTDNTLAIHHYDASWYRGNKLLKKIKYRLIPFKQFIKYKILRKKLYE